MSQSEAERVERYRSVLHMVAELHRRGHERIRICPGLAPSGLYWRCTVAPAALFSVEHGAMLASADDDVVARYTTGDEDRYFGWDDARTATPSELAELFVQRFPRIAEAGSGSDAAYAQWYVEMLELTH